MIITKTPLRLSFVGGGSDMKAFYVKKDGMVLCSAIDKFVYAIVKERFDDMIYINYSEKECADHVDKIQHDLVREAMKMAGVSKGIEITTLADIPSTGSGLGSSSSITVALLHALYTYQNILVTAERLAMDACRIEIDILKKPIGRQDQYAAAFGGVNQFTFSPTKTTKRTPVKMGSSAKRKFASSLLLYYTGISRSADKILSNQEKNLLSGKKFKTMEKMVSLVEPFKKALKKEDIKECGMLMDLNWKLKQQMATNISNTKIQKMYNMAKNAGALAGKIAGAGGGGFLLFIVLREKQNAVFSALKEYRELPFMLEESGSKVIFDDRAYSSK
ncbi:MAG: GHMP kinase [Desulfobacterales bacterium]|jgi:D-glycero-alpha-D-manno-heptose-7-phosphate kinase|nr:GHMP kinase [Desulfobacterales bacterium]MDP6683485.1 GHMP kinase [Desulfobacterales bacterium]MDP6807311.1 GHMP kinase [Desulfobacterales bacterium]|tara:strand:- start:32057 stop:33052 length:996 start_codon:yes stop_codon:yes gene_type:complete